VPVEVRTRFERFPATAKGAFVMRGADGNPHTVRLERAAVVRVPTGPEKAVTGVAVQVDVAPSRDLYVPFEASLADLEPGWYALRSWVRVDGGREYAFNSRAFSVPWPRAEVRRGSIRVERSTKVGGSTFRIERVELGSDAAIVTWSPAPAPSHRPRAAPEDASLAELLVSVDGQQLEVVPPDLVRIPPGRVGSSEQRTVAYPVAQGARALAICVRLPSGEVSPTIRLALG
jgi:hypothetical protein